MTNGALLIGLSPTLPIVQNIDFLGIVDSSDGESKSDDNVQSNNENLNPMIISWGSACPRNECLVRVTECTIVDAMHDELLLTDC